MNYTEAKAKIEEYLGMANSIFEGLGIRVNTDIEIAENQISEEESEPLLILGSVALSADELTEDDTFYISVDARIEDGEVDGEMLTEALKDFESRCEAIYERLNPSENKAATIIELGREVDEELERIYQEEVERNERAIMRDLKVAIFGTIATLLFVIAATIISGMSF